MSPLPAQRRLPRPFPLTRRAAVVLSALLLLAIALALVWLASARQPATPRPGFGKEAVPVSVAPATSGPLRLDLHALGTITPLARVVLRTQVDGELLTLHFTEGQEVRPGQLLAEIDPRPYHATLAVAEGELARSQALQANADMDLRRYRALARNDAVAGQKLDAAEAQARMTAAQVARDQARVDEARRQLALTRITAPQGGRIGLRRIDAGNHVRASDADGLTTLVQTRPISAVFSIPETRLDALRRAQAGGAALRVQAWDADERRIVAEGTLQALDNRIQAATGTVKLRAHFDNADEALFPNQFVNI
ncbi:efflux RND transporter periplasmic adaptor subunit, partial [Achromobacter sp. Marseille-Q0513]|uniref:efflux RND transporter periplasmic adaptor subunit n=1 Tax=Achromobacter sp. Marseille-Q0513 TaxID=2829161 RepID=UPI001BA1D75B